MPLFSANGIVLRKFEEADAEHLFVFRNDPNVTQGLVGSSSGYSKEDLISWIEHHRNRLDEVIWAIANASGDVCIGHVGLYQIDHRVGKAEFAILIGDTDFQGKGLGRKISHWVIDYGFNQLNLNKVSLTVLPINGAALSLYQSLGFQQDGVLRSDQYRDGQYLDVVIMSVLRSEWMDRGQLGED